ncbi:Mechanosensitive ion channel-domain-containing protein [Cantharellus anzutake]|uniref:Mechanosensitive ion channel-domain-containing protein n=1 Tax=Cantharellus anzutake TaxID=1750568 RepID=UPI001906CBB4|nr:Mechanosensitive ion channel-domain-containing protein [Cantharellus anzutake]KAF8326601.1 Mechanosensitive ion channel-domain-containing protein [Cantharellus anzutake]
MAFRQPSTDLESLSTHTEKYEMNASEHPSLSPQNPNFQIPVKVEDPNPTHSPKPNDSDSTDAKRPAQRRDSSWNILGSLRKNIDEFDAKNGSQINFQVAEGDLPEGKLMKIYTFLLSSSIITRWIIFIVPIMALLWIPGILSVTSAPKATIWHVRLLWWSVWFSIIWGGWWAALAFAMVLPHFLRGTFGVAAVSLHKYIDWLNALHRPVAFVAWSIAVFVTYNPIIYVRFTHENAQKYPSSQDALVLTGRLVFGLVLSSVSLLAEKFCIQLIAYKFHERSYSDRIARAKAQVECLVTLYKHSDRLHALQNTQPSNGAISPAKLLKRILKGVRRTAETTTTAFGNMASEIAGTSVLQPNSPAAMVAGALECVNKSRVLARRLYYSFLSEGADRLVLEDISRFFPNREKAAFAFEIFDRDENGDVTRDEIEATILDIHHERLALANSMKDVDSATGRLDNIFITFYILLVLLIFAIMLDASISSIITGAGSAILGLSWLIGSSAQEVLASIIFLFMKHPFDIGDNIEIDKEAFTVKEMRLLSTVFVDSRGCDVQCPNTVLNTKYILNKRRSGPMSEAFEFNVDFSTSFEQIEDLRSRMLTFVKAERRDYLPVFDVYVIDIPEQTSMKLKAGIKYKSNWQMGALKVQRRNKWICALKNALKASKIYGPTGNPNAAKEDTLAPYQEAGIAKAPTSPEPFVSSSPSIGRTDFQFTDKNSAILPGATNVFGEEGELRTSVAREGVRDELSSPFTGGSATESSTMRGRNVGGGAFRGSI